MEGTLGSRRDARDAGRFVGRARELSVIDRLLGDDPRTSVLFVHGPGGIGKSTLLREATRRALLAGFDVRAVDGREAATDPAGLAATLDGLAESARPLVVIDTYELISAVGGALRTAILPSLPASTRVLIAGRRPPEPEWHEGGWEAVTTTLALGPLDDAEARLLLRHHGVEDEAREATLLTWSRGLPLALAMGADAAVAAGAVELRSLDDDRALAAALLGRLAGDEPEGADRDVLAVAAIAPAVDARLLAAALPGIDPDRAESWLRGLSFAVPAGPRVRLHDRVAAAMRTKLRTADPQRERELRRRIGDHLHDRAATGRPGLIAELISLIEDPAIRAGFALESGDRFRIDRVRAGDAAAAVRALGAEDSVWWPGVRRYLEEAPDRVIVARDARGALAGFSITVTPATAPPWIDEDAVLGPWIAHARRRAPDGNALLWRNTFDLTGGEDSPIAALLNMAGIQMSGLANVRLIYGHVDPDDEEQRELSRAIGAVMVPELTVRDRDRDIECHLIDHGEGGILAAARGLLYADLRLPRPPARTRDEVGADAVRDALRAFHDPLALAASPLAQGATVEERASSVRVLLREGLMAAFGDARDEWIQRSTIELGYLDGHGGHARAALALNVSRTTYFRRLAEASDRLARYVIDRRS
ncbi:MAG: ATP-binding protein [Thermoleophilia bacterium]